MTEAGQRSSGTQSLDRAVELVDAVVRADEAMSFAELLEQTGLAKSTTSRLLGALERGGLIAREENGAYVAGSLFWLYGARHDPWEETIRLARPLMEEVSEATGETVHLSVVRNAQVAQVAQVDSQYLLGSRDWTEVHVPPHGSAMGKVFHAWGALEISEDSLEPLTEMTITEPATLESDSSLSRRRGWALSHDELELGLTGLAAPVRGIRGDVVAALGISGPTPRIEHRLEEFGNELTSHAAQLSSLLRNPSRRTQHHAAASTPKEGVA